MAPTESDIRLSGLLRVGSWQTVEEAHEHALVVVAMGMNCSVHPIGGGYELLTSPDDAATASHELELYDREQHETRKPPPLEIADHPPGWIGFLIWAIVLAACFRLQMIHPELTGRFSNSSAGIVGDGEWWRPFTALFLHADPIHLAGNVLIGGMFCLLASKALGTALAWPLIFAAGTFGNAIQAVLRHPEPFSSIGASTATFGALGILVGLAFVEAARTGSGMSLRRLSIPLLAGLILFGWFGISGERTDIGGHAWGGLSGLALGSLAGWLRTKAPQTAS